MNETVRAIFEKSKQLKWFAGLSDISETLQFGHSHFMFCITFGVCFFTVNLQQNCFHSELRQRQEIKVGLRM
jgi:hypothetical protein